jgi:succinyldiaminopimelate transaminase
VLDATGTYPFVRMAQARRAVEARGVDVIDFTTGEPREETPAFIRQALVAAVEAEPISGYPSAEGLPELRAAIAAWLARRFGATVDPDRHVIPTLGAKEAVFSLADVLVDRDGGRDVVAVTTPSYPVYERGALYAGATVAPVPLDPAAGFRPSVAALDGLPWDRLALLWVNSPNNPTAATLDRDDYAALAARCRDHGVVLASDEAYSELWFAGDPPASVLELDALDNVLAVNTLSKRSSMPGYRSGFVAGDPELIAMLKRFRPSVGTAPQTFVQRAAVAAWGDEEHVVATRAAYAAKRDVLLSALLDVGLRPAGGDGSFFLWLAVPDGEDDAAFCARWLERGLAFAPGSAFGAAGAGHVRVALVPTLEACVRARERLDGAV